MRAMSGQTECECVVVGGGPAGATLAGLLAQRGHRVVLVDDGRDRRAMPEETLLPAALRTLDQLGLRAAVTVGASPDPLPHGALWDSNAVVWQPAGDAGLRVARGAFDAHLRGWARDCGAQVVSGSVVGPLPAGAGAVRVAAAAGGVHELRAQVCVVAAGRAVSGRLVPWRVVAESAPTAALCLRGECPVEAAGGAVIEAVRDGWLWWAPLLGGGVSLGVFVDQDQLRARGARQLVATLRAQARGPARTLLDARLAHAVVATARLRHTAAPVLLVGDAAATLDPLSSQGVEKALAGAEHAACAVHTALRRPELRALALAEHSRWERGLWRAHAAVAAAYYRRETRFADAPFWRRRQVPESPPVAAVPQLLVAAPGLRECTVLRRHGHELVPEPGHALPDAGVDPVGHVGPVATAPLLAAFTTPCTVGAGIAQAARDPRLFVLPPRLVQDAVVELWRRGYLVAAAGSPE